MLYLEDVPINELNIEKNRENFTDILYNDTLTVLLQTKFNDLVTFENLNTVSKIFSFVKWQKLIFHSRPQTR